MKSARRYAGPAHGALQGEGGMTMDYKEHGLPPRTAGVRTRAIGVAHHNNWIAGLPDLRHRRLTRRGDAVE